MIALSWNVRGLGNPRTFRALKLLLREKFPNMVFLMETHMTETQMERVKHRLGMHMAFVVKWVGMGGGLMMLCKYGWSMNLLSSSVGHIDVIIHSPNGDAFHVTGFYGHHEAHSRKHSWELLRRLHHGVNGPWLVLGDFNEVLSAEEQRGCRERPIGQMTQLKNAIRDCSLISLPFKGYPFTWAGRRNESIMTEVRLDIGLANADLLNRFPDLLIQHLDTVGSDHKPILLNVSTNLPQQQGRKNARGFQFEQMWVQEASCEEVVKEVWKDTRGLDSNVTISVAHCADSLTTGNHQHFGNIQKKLRIAHAELCKLQNGKYEQVWVSRRREVEREINNLLEAEETMWNQRSRVTWLKKGDRNTRFFHEKAKSRGRNNTIQGLFDESNVWQSDSDNIGSMFCNYFNGLFTQIGGQDMEQVLAAITPCVTMNMNKILLGTFNRLELEQALGQMYPTKAPGIDRMPALFYQRYWHIVGDSVSDTCLRILNGEGSVRYFNHTLIALISKITQPTRVTDFRPISLCTVLYKLVAKAFVNRLKMVLPEVISESQSAFVPGRHIIDNVMYAFEVVHHMKGPRSGNGAKMALKLDMAKAYDRVEWCFVEVMMHRLGFAESWITRIMDCITTVSFSVLWQGNPLGHIVLHRGIRQGCPLSPYIFLICAEGFTGLIQQAEQLGRIRGVKVAAEAPPVSHLFFADYSLIFLEAKREVFEEVKGIFATYEKASGQKINLAKSAVSFSSNITTEIIDAARNILQVPVVACHERYLGLPTVVGRNRHSLFLTVQERVKRKVQGWKEIFLSNASKEILIKSMAQAVPTYSMSCFRMPKSVSKSFIPYLQSIGGERVIGGKVFTGEDGNFYAAQRSLADWVFETLKILTKLS
ncbi:unnamed protein product [Prunus armeniaca]